MTKWEGNLACSISPAIWQGIWLKYCEANKNLFLWQLAYRVLATQRWRFPTLPANDAATWCTRCDLAVREDISRCIWSCPLSNWCWQWGMSMLTAISHNRHNVGGLPITLTAAHVFIAHPLPVEWKILAKFWHILRAVSCWQIWKAKNEHYMANDRSGHRRTIRKSWHRFGTYLRKEWRHLV